MNREIKYKSVFKEYKTGKLFIGNETWGVIQGGFASPSTYSHAERIADLQFTGLTDKKGKGIYEGDICSTDSKEYAMNKSVVWNDRHACFEFDYPLGKSILQRSSIEVIGNIYENPELLIPTIKLNTMPFKNPC
jgi:hypothetical protein